MIEFLRLFVNNKRRAAGRLHSTKKSSEFERYTALIFDRKTGLLIHVVLNVSIKIFINVPLALKRTFNSLSNIFQMV